MRKQQTGRLATLMRFMTPGHGWKTLLVVFLALVSGVAAAETGITLPVERCMLFNKWTDGADYGDYYSSAWTHEGGGPSGVGVLPFLPTWARRFLLPGTNHVHSSGWKVIGGRTGTISAQSGTKFVPPKLYSTPSSYTNWQANLHNTLTARIESPFYTNGIGTLYFDAVNVTDSSDIRLEIVTNMVSRFDETSFTSLLPEENTTWKYNWVSVETITLNSESCVNVQKTLEYYGPIRFRICRATKSATSYSSEDNAFLAIDNIRVSYPGIGVTVAPGTITKVSGVLARANVICKVSNASSVEGLPPAMFSDHASRTVTVYYKPSTSAAYSSAVMNYVEGTGDGKGGQESYTTEISFPVGTEKIDYYYECVASGNRYFPVDCTLTGVTYWPAHGGGEPPKKAQTAVVQKDVSAWSQAKSSSLLEVNRLMLFNKWTNGVDYGDYYAGGWTHEGGAPSGVGILPFLPTWARRFLLPGTNHVHSSGWKVIEGRTGTISAQSGTKCIPPKLYSTPSSYTNWQANLHNTLTSRIESPFYTNGLGTLYFDAVNVTDPSWIKVQIATNMVNVLMGETVPEFYPEEGTNIVVNEYGQTITNVLAYRWVDISSNNLNAADIPGTEGFLRYQATLNYRDSIRFRVVRQTKSDILYSSDDNAFLAIDNIQVSTPPADVTIRREELPFDPGYPSIGQTLTVRCRVDNVGKSNLTTSEDRNVQVVSRWRYLDQTVGKWMTNTMDYVAGAAGDDGKGNGELYLGEIPAQEQVGDVEYYFICNFDGYRYVPVDYAMAGHSYWPNVIDHSESLSPRTLRNTTDLGGSREFYVRLRPYVSSIGKMMITTDFLDEPVEMEMVGDDIWRGMVPLSSLDDGTFCCSIWTTNTYVAAVRNGILMHSLDTTPRYWAEAAQSTNVTAIAPTGGNCQELASPHWMKFRVTDSAYAGIQVNLKTMEYTVCRTEYQSFNEWTSYTNFFAMTFGQPDKTAYKENFDRWNLDVDSIKIENFVGYPVSTNTYMNSFETFGQFRAWNATYASELTKTTATNSPLGQNQSGTAGDRIANVSVRLAGGDFLNSAMNTNGINGFGYLNTLGESLTDGLKSYSFKARLNTPITAAQLVQYIGDDMPKVAGTIPQNYTFWASCKGMVASPEEHSFSVVAYIQDDGSFYEFRVTQCKTASGSLGTSPSRARLELFRWNGGIPVLLATRTDLISATLCSQSSTFLPSIKVATSSRTTTITGTCNTFSVVYTDASPARLQKGNAGLMVINCQAQFYNAGVQPNDSSTSVSLPFDNATAAYNWRIPSGRYIIDANYLTSVMPIQTLSLYVQNTEYNGGGSADPADGGWTLAETFTVSSYTYTSFTYTPKTWRAQHVKLQNAGRADIGIDEIEMRSWHGQTTGGNLLEWTAEEAWTTTAAESSRGRVVELDMTRADEREGGGEEEGTRQGIVSPMLERGRSQLSFDYKIITPPVELTVQEQDEGGVWRDIPGASFTNLTATGWQHGTTYVGNTNAGSMRLIHDARHGITNGIVQIDNVVVWDEPAVTEASWKVYNGMVTDADKGRVTLDESKVLFLNDSVSNNVTADMRPMNIFQPYLKTPFLVNGLGELRFEARLYDTNATGGIVLVYGLTNDNWYAEDNWIKIDELCITNVAKQYYTAYLRDPASYDNLTGTEFKAVKLGTLNDGTLPRICLENVSASEPVYPGFDINNVKLLYHKNNNEYGVREPQQPLDSDLIGIEARLTNLRLGPSNIHVYVSYYVGTNVWGIENIWGHPDKDTWRPGQTTTIAMEQMPDDPQVYRTPFNNDIPFQEENTIVQYCVWATYWDAQGVQKYFQRQKEDSFNTPSWYYPFDLNALYKSWSPYFIVYKIPHGCVFVNEINFNESKDSAEAAGDAHNPYVELAVPSGINLSGWCVDLVKREDGKYQSSTYMITMDSTGMAEVTNGFAFYLMAENMYLPGLPFVDQNIAGFFTQETKYTGGVRIRRPLGMYEHAVGYDYYYDPYGNVDIAAQDPEKRLVFVGMDYAFASLSVTNGTGETIADWSMLSTVANLDIPNQRVFPEGTRVWTPRAPNLCQVMPPLPEIFIGNDNISVTALLTSPDLALQNGSQNKLAFILTKGKGWTNIVYDTRNWYRITGLTANRTNNLMNSPWFVQNPNSPTNYTLLLTNLQAKTEIVATIERDPNLDDLRLPPSVLGWLLSFPDSQIKYDSWSVPDNRNMTFTELYWLNCDPTNTYVLDGGLTGVVERAAGGSNVFLSVWMTLNGQNVTTLRGNSDADRPAFKIKVKQDLTSPRPWVTARQYTFTEDSFGADHSCRILIDTFPFIDGTTIDMYPTAFFKWMLEYDEQYIERLPMTNCPAASH